MPQRVRVRSKSCPSRVEEFYSSQRRSTPSPENLELDLRTYHDGSWRPRRSFDDISDLREWGGVPLSTIRRYRFIRTEDPATGRVRWRTAIIPGGKWYYICSEQTEPEKPEEEETDGTVGATKDSQDGGRGFRAFVNLISGKFVRGGGTDLVLDDGVAQRSWKGPAGLGRKRGEGDSGAAVKKLGRRERVKAYFARKFVKAKGV